MVKTVIESKDASDVLGNPEKIYPQGDIYGWRDITGPIIVKGVGSSDPNWAQIGDSVFFAYKFSIGDECWIPFHIPHDIVPGGDIHLHAHWISDGTNTNPVKWEFTYMYARGFNQDAFDPDGVVKSAQQNGPGVPYRHMVTETGAISVDTLNEPDGILYVKVERVTNDATDNNDDVFLLTADVHYQSTGMATFGKAPNFYNE